MTEDIPEPYPDADALYLVVGGTLALMIFGILTLRSQFSLFYDYAAMAFMFGYLGWIFGVPIALLFDAKKVHAGTRTKTRLFHVSTWGPWEWAILEFFFAIIFLPLYALKRKKIYRLNREPEDNE